MERERSITDEMFSAVRQGNIEIVSKIIDQYGLSFSSAWEGGYSLLWDALKNRHSEVAKLLINKSCAVSRKYDPFSHRLTILDWCILHDDIELFEMILKRGANINISFPLENSVRLKEVIELLLKYGADVNAECPFNRTLLHQAVDMGCLDTIEFLLNRGANINVCMCSPTLLNYQGYTPLHFAVKNNFEKVVKLLLSRGANVNAKAKNDKTPLLIATSKCHENVKFYFRFASENIVKLLLEAGADVNCTSNYKSTPLLMAIRNRNNFCVYLLLQRGAKIEPQEIFPYTALREAVECRHPGIIKKILQHCPDINNQSNKCCLQLATKGFYNKDIIDSLLEYGFSLLPEDANDAKLLHNSVKNGHLRVIEDLLKYGANVNMLCRGGFTPLHTAVECKQKEAVELLIKYGANINAKAKKGETPIRIALKKHCSEICNIFLNLNASTEDQPDLLNLAVKAGSEEIIETLLQRGFDVNASNLDGSTALHDTINRFYSPPYLGASRAKIAELLITKGANVNAQDHDGKTTLHYACYKKLPDLIKTLLYYGADINLKGSDSSTPLETAWIEYNENQFLSYYDTINANEVFYILKCHVIQMKIANLFLDKGNLEIMEELGTMNQNTGLQCYCKKEIAGMKNKTFENSSISLYEILVNDTKILAKYMNQENIVQELKSENYKSKFPIYARMIEINFKKGMDRKKLFDEAKYNFHFVFNPFNDECANRILDLLCESDLQNLKDAFSLHNGL